MPIFKNFVVEFVHKIKCLTKKEMWRGFRFMYWCIFMKTLELYISTVNPCPILCFTNLKLNSHSLLLCTCTLMHWNVCWHGSIVLWIMLQKINFFSFSLSRGMNSMLRMLVVNIIPSVLEVLLVSSILVSIQGKEFNSCHL